MTSRRADACMGYQSATLSIPLQGLPECMHKPTCSTPHNRLMAAQSGALALLHLYPWTVA